MEPRTKWHRLFGLFLMDLFAGSPYEVDTEVDLSHKAQFLDVVVVRKDGGGDTPRLPDGLGGHLVDHNLISFKSHQGTLDAWAMKELIGHYVNYRKQAGPSVNEMPPEGCFRLFAVSARFPEGLARQVPLTEVCPGVYDCDWGIDAVRVIVTSRLESQKQNAVLLLFSAQQEQVKYGAEHFRRHDPATSTLIDDLLREYNQEGIHMPYTLEDFKRDYDARVLREMPPEKRLEGLSPDALLAALSPEMRDALKRQLLAESQPPAPR